MKIQTTILTVIAAAAFVVAGCSKQSSSTAGDQNAAVANVDTTKAEAAFASADGATKRALASVIGAVKNADYSGAVTQLKSFGEKYKLTEEQQTAVNELLVKAQKALADMAAKSAGDASKAATDMSKALGK